MTDLLTMQEQKLYTCMGLIATNQGLDFLVLSVEPFLRICLLVLQIIIAAFAVALLYKTARNKK